MDWSRVTQIGLDAHRRFSNLTGRDSEGRIVCRQRVDHGDRGILRESLALWPRVTPVVLEGIFGWGWPCDELEAGGLKPHLACSRKVAGWRDVRGIAKSNQTDAHLLSELPSEKSQWWEVWLAPQEVGDQREWMGYRMSLVKMQTRVKNQIHAIMHRHGVVHEFSDLFGRDGRCFLHGLTGTSNATLRGSPKATLKGYLQVLAQVRRQIAGATPEIRGQLTRDPDGERLRTIPGIKWILGYTIPAEIGRIDRFKKAKRLAWYALLVPRAQDTGQPDDEPPKGRHVGRRGGGTLKWAFIEAAHGAVRQGGRFREIFDGHTDGGKKNRNRGYITVGRELARVVYVMLSKRVDYMATPPDRPGRASKTKRCVRRTSRWATGQPDHPLVVAV